MFNITKHIDKILKEFNEFHKEKGLIKEEFEFIPRNIEKRKEQEKERKSKFIKKFEEIDGLGIPEDYYQECYFELSLSMLIRSLINDNSNGNLFDTIFNLTLDDIKFQVYEHYIQCFSGFSQCDYTDSSYAQILDIKHEAINLYNEYLEQRKNPQRLYNELGRSIKDF